VSDPDVLTRIRALAIPPAWRDVWICRDALGHLQATGIDVAGRRQYRYHDRWHERRDRQKFDEMLAFARALPALRRVTRAHLNGEGLTRERVLAAAVRLLDLGFFRVGSESYAQANGTFGLATLRRSHVQVEARYVLRFDYPAKGGKRRIQSVVDPAVYELVAALKRRPGRGGRLLVYEAAGRWHDIRSADINAYIREATDGEFSAKDVRTWNATVLAAVAVAVAAGAETPTARKRAISRAVGEVAHYLGNTPAVCRSAYVDPRVFDRFNAGATIASVLEQLGERDPHAAGTQNAIDKAVLDLLEDRVNADAGAGCLGRATHARRPRRASRHPLPTPPTRSGGRAA
jgi:DNA topoisomerase IB